MCVRAMHERAPAELVGVVGECVVSCARGQLSLSRCTTSSTSSCSSFSVLVEERSSIAWKAKTLCSRRLLGRRRLCAVVDCLEKTLCSRRLLGRRRLSAVVDCLERGSKTAPGIEVVCCRRLFGTWKMISRCSVLLSTGCNWETRGL